MSRPASYVMFIGEIMSRKIVTVEMDDRLHTVKEIFVLIFTTCRWSKRGSWSASYQIGTF
jgi:hypothetical protein